MSTDSNSRPMQSSDDALGPLHQAALGVRGRAIPPWPARSDTSDDTAMTANGRSAILGLSVVARYQATPPMQQRSR